MLAVAACISGVTAIFGIYDKEALCSPLMFTAMARRFLYIEGSSLAIHVYSNGTEILVYDVKHIFFDFFHFSPKSFLAQIFRCK